MISSDGAKKKRGAENKGRGDFLLFLIEEKASTTQTKSTRGQKLFRKMAGDLLIHPPFYFILM